MKISKHKFLPFLAIFYLAPSLGQEIDPSLLSELSPAEIELVRSQIERGDFLGEAKTLASPVITESTLKIDTESRAESLEEKKFGYDYFSTIPTTITAVGDLPLPNDYKISLKDQFTIILSGSKEDIFDLEVKLDGTILFPELGSISVAGETFDAVKSKLNNLINQSYIGAQIDISLKSLAAKKITIVGAVGNAGTYLVNPFSTISSALAYSGGITDIGTLRNIRLLRTNGEIVSFDLYKLLVDGDRSDDVTIEAGDVIVVDPAKQFIKLAGEVRRPAIYEVLEGEDLSDLFRFGLGLSNVANKTNISLQILDLNSSSIRNLKTNDLFTSLDNVLSVEVNKYVSRDVATIEVGGAIREPGYYDISENKDLKQLIDKLVFIDAYPWLGVIEQFDEANLIKSTTLFSLKDKSTYESIKLLPNSKIFFANIDDQIFEVGSISSRLIDDYSLNIIHKGSTYTMPVFGDYSVREFIDFLGLDMSDVNDEATYISPLENNVVVKNYKDMTFSSKKYQTVLLRSPVNNLIEVTVLGAIDYPGTYQLSPNSTLEDLYSLVGDFKDEAFIEGIIFTRKSVRDRQLKSIEQSRNALNQLILTSNQKGQDIGDISLLQELNKTIEPENLGRIAGNFSPNSQSSKNTILFDNDAIIVPINPNVVNVFGEVLNPLAFEYNNKLNVRSAISSAGGYNKYADRSRVYVIKANGLIERAPKNIFGQNIKLGPGDTIVVPRKLITNNPGIDALLPITQILSDLAFSAAALENLSNN